MALLDDNDVLAAVLAIVLAPPPTRAETIKEAWRIAGDRFDFAAGKLIVRHDLDIVPEIVFEIVEYAGVTAIEAEGVIVAKYPKIG